MRNYYGVLLFWMCNLYTPANSYDTTFCAGIPDGLFPDAVDCASYYQCDAGVTYHYTCNIGTLYDITLEACNYDTQVTCAGSTPVVNVAGVKFYQHLSKVFSSVNVLSVTPCASSMLCAMTCARDTRCMSANYRTFSNLCETLSTQPVKLADINSSLSVKFLCTVLLT